MKIVFREPGQFRVLGGDAPTLHTPPTLAALEQLDSIGEAVADVDAADATPTLHDAFKRLKAILDAMKKEESRMVAAALAFAPGMDQQTNMSRQWRQMRDMWIRANHEIMSFLPSLCVEDQSKAVAWLSRQADRHPRWRIDGHALDIGKMPTIALHK